MTFASKAYEYLGNEEQAKEYLNLLNQDIPIKEDSTKNTSKFPPYPRFINNNIGIGTSNKNFITRHGIDVNYKVCIDD